MAALNANAEHRLVVVDDSGISSVALCFCGRSWVATGPDRVRDARYEHATHVFSAGSAMAGSSGRARALPERDELPNTPTPPKGRPVGSSANATSRRHEIGALFAQGIEAESIASSLQISLAYVERVLSGISQEK